MPAPPRRPSECDWQSKFSPRRHGDTEKNKTSFTADERGWARIRSRSAANEEIAKIEKPTPTPLKHGGSRNPAADWRGPETHTADDDEEIAKIAIIAGIAKIEKPNLTPLKHGGNGGSGGKKIARDRAESHVSAVIGKATPTTEATEIRRIAKIAIIAGIAKIEKPTPTPLKHRVSGVSGGRQNQFRRRLTRNRGSGD